MRLRRLFFLLSLGLSLTVVAMAAYVVRGAWREVHQATAGLESMQELRALLIAGEMAARERRLTDALLGDTMPDESLKRGQLRAARQVADAAFDTLEHVLYSAAESRESTHQAVLLARRHLDEARQSADVLDLKGPAARSPEELRAAASQMVGVIDDLAPAGGVLANDASARFPTATDALAGARQAALLRAYAGLLGSQLTAPLSTRQPLTPEERMTIDRLHGRIDQLRQQLMVGAASVEARPSIQAAAKIMLTRYFNSALPFLEKQADIGMHDGRYEVSTTDFITRYGPGLDAIVILRDALLGEAMADAHQGLEQARRAALWTVAGTALMLLLLVATWWLLHRRVVRPLTRTTELIVTIAQGHLDVDVPLPRHRDEVADMLGAIAVLRDNSIARRAADDAIRQMAYYDRLTGLPNRRLLEDRMQQVLAVAKRQHAKVSVLFIDLDKFKQVNDEQGHEAGDWLLQQVAQRMRAVLRASDTAARVGGDEFVVLLPDAVHLDDAVHVAEKIRLQMENPFTMDDGVTLDISSSIGVAMYPDQADNPRDLLRFGDEAMYKAKRRGRNAIEVFAAQDELGGAQR